MKDPDTTTSRSEGSVLAEKATRLHDVVLLKPILMPMKVPLYTVHSRLLTTAFEHETPASFLTVATKISLGTGVKEDHCEPLNIIQACDVLSNLTQENRSAWSEARLSLNWTRFTTRTAGENITNNPETPALCVKPHVTPDLTGPISMEGTNENPDPSCETVIVDPLSTRKLVRRVTVIKLVPRGQVLLCAILFIVKAGVFTAPTDTKVDEAEGTLLSETVTL
mmetsp:Transcript_20194/g.55947  ORF Transcript_20194/g.55947 Transcript_20194/m.55947 type:complete len:223 (+) Transcript_20194:260-928(+)